MPKYTIRKNRLKSAFIEGFTLTEKGSLVYDKDSMFHWVFLKALDGAADDSEWGRLFLNITRSDDMVLSVYVVATNIMDMTTGDYEGTVDDCHPTDFGFASMAKALTEVLSGIDIR